MLTDNFLTVKEALEYLRLNGVEYHEVYVRTLIGIGKIRSKKVFNSRVVSRDSLNKVIAERRAER